MVGPHLLAADCASAYLYAVLGHGRLGYGTDVGEVGQAHSLMLEPASTPRAGVRCHRYVYRRLGDLIGRRRPSVAEQPHAGLAARALGIGPPRSFGERRCLALSRTLEFGDLLAQLFVGRIQLPHLLLESDNQGQQLTRAQRGEDIGRKHSQSLKLWLNLCNPSNPSANQLPPFEYHQSHSLPAPEMLVRPLVSKCRERVCETLVASLIRDLSHLCGLW